MARNKNTFKPLIPTTPPPVSKEHQIQVDAIRAASLCFPLGSPRHTAHVRSFINGEWDGPVTFKPFAELGEALRVSAESGCELAGRFS